MFGYDFRIKGVDIALKALKIRYKSQFSLGIVVTNHLDRAKTQQAMFKCEWVRLLPARTT